MGVILVGLALRIAWLAGVSELSVSVLTPCRIDTLAVGGLLAIAGPSRGARHAPGRARWALLLVLLGAVLAVSLFGV